MNNTTIKAEIVAHSINPQGDELISVLCTFPRIILAEVNTHRMLSKNTSSSRAIPFSKMMEAVEKDPFIPIAWQKAHKGMQGNQYWDDEMGVAMIESEWLLARDFVMTQAKILNDCEITKQLCNRLLEPFMWTTMLITGSREGWSNFLRLRCPQYAFKDLATGKETFYYSKKELMKSYSDSNMDYANKTEWLKCNKGQAEIHIMELAEQIYDAWSESIPKQLKEGEWHIPFENKLGDISTEDKIKCSVAMAARTSYTVVGEEKELDVNKLISLHDKLLSQDPPHSSPLEHCARAMNNYEYKSFMKGRIGRDDHEYGWCNNFKGFMQYRYMIDNGNN